MQYWRLLVHHLACASSSDLLLTELLLYNIGIPIERAFGGVKYAVSATLDSDLGMSNLTAQLVLLRHLRRDDDARFFRHPPTGAAHTYDASKFQQHSRRPFCDPIRDRVSVYALGPARLPLQGLWTRHERQDLDVCDRFPGT